MDNMEIEYREHFVNERVPNDPNSIQYVMSEIKSVHNIENGWIVGEPTIVVNPDKVTVTLSVDLIKTKVESRGGR